jgi:hypothetical protein
LDCPLSGSSLVLIEVTLVLGGDVVLLGIVCIWRLNDGEHSLNDEICVQSGNPLLIDGLGADFSG